MWFVLKTSRNGCFAMTVVVKCLVTITTVKCLNFSLGTVPPPRALAAPTRYRQRITQKENHR